jgi:hypothetical protein
LDVDEEWTTIEDENEEELDTGREMGDSSTKTTLEFFRGITVTTLLTGGGGGGGGADPVREPMNPLLGTERGVGSKNAPPRSM